MRQPPDRNANPNPNPNNFVTSVSLAEVCALLTAIIAIFRKCYSLNLRSTVIVLFSYSAFSAASVLLKPWRSQHLDDALRPVTNKRINKWMD